MNFLIGKLDGDKSTGLVRSISLPAEKHGPDTNYEVIYSDSQLIDNTITSVG